MLLKHKEGPVSTVSKPRLTSLQEGGDSGASGLAGGMEAESPSSLLSTWRRNHETMRPSWGKFRGAAWALCSLHWGGRKALRAPSRQGLRGLWEQKTRGQGAPQHPQPLARTGNFQNFSPNYNLREKGGENSFDRDLVFTTVTGQ